MDKLPIPDYYSNYLKGLPKKALNALNSLSERLRYSIVETGPIICQGVEDCPFQHHCPLIKRQEGGLPIYNDEGYVVTLADPPEGLQCLVEMQYVTRRVQDYVRELDVDMENVVEMPLVQELATMDLLKQRAMMMMAESANGGLLLTTETQLQFGVETHTELHPLLNLINQQEKRRQQILKGLMRTREAEQQSALIAVQQKSLVLRQLETVANRLGEMQDTPEIQLLTVDE